MQEMESHRLSSAHREHVLVRHNALPCWGRIVAEHRTFLFWPNRTLQLWDHTLLRTLKEIFRHLQSQPVRKVIAEINPVLRGWVQYFAVGHASRCFSYVRNWVEQKVRRHLMRARNRPGLGWTRWRRRWLYDTLGLYGDYRIRYRGASLTALPTR